LTGRRGGKEKDKKGFLFHYWREKEGAGRGRFTQGPKGTTLFFLPKESPQKGALREKVLLVSKIFA